MTTFDRDCLLQLGLESIRRYNKDVDILVVNDGKIGNAPIICKQYGAEHLFTGQRNTDEMHWRIPGFALNIGVQHTQSEIIFLTCAEMWHVTDCVGPMIKAVENDPKALAIPEGKDDMNNRYLPNLDDEQRYNECVKLKTELPFLMAMRRECFTSIGGYDEDFLGQSYDDDDIVHRLQLSGCHYVLVKEARCVHLYHPRYCHDKRTAGRLALNKKLFEERKGTIHRNPGKVWGCTLKEYWDEQHRIHNTKWLANSAFTSYCKYLGLSEADFKRKTILEIGVGTGNATKSISQLASRLDALDISDVALSNVKDVIHTGYNNPSLLPFDTYDMALSFLVVQHMNNEDLAHQFKNVIAALKKDGVFYIQFADAKGPIKGTIDELSRGGGMIRSSRAMEKLIYDAGGVVEDLKALPLKGGNVTWYFLTVKKCH